MIDVNDSGQHVGQCLTGPGLSHAHHVRTGHGNGPALRLNGGGPVKTLLLDLLQDVVGGGGLAKLFDGIGGVALERHLVLLAECLHFGGVTVQNGRGRVEEVLLERGQIAPVDGAQGTTHCRVLAATSTISSATETTATASVAATTTAIASSTS
uniref:Uncharacterized protein n=1 Tax=Cacopsylla melanoneura TaxID=428564 RepID=A0A8D8XK76_9HEMI